MATYSNKHWLLSHIRNSFISTDDTGMCETVMLSDDMPKHFLRKYQEQQSDKSQDSTNQSDLSESPVASTSAAAATRLQGQAGSEDPPLRPVDFICYPGLDLSDDEDIDSSAHSFDIQMYPEVGAHRFRSNTAQKLEKMDLAKRKAARIKTVNYNEEVIKAVRPGLFVRKPVPKPEHERVAIVDEKQRTTKEQLNNGDDANDSDNAGKDGEKKGRKSLLAIQLAKAPKQVQNKFIDYARFDGTSQVGVLTKRINVFLNMLPECERNYPIKICVLATAKICEVIGLVCYKASLQFPDVPLKSIQHYALYMTEDNDDMEDFPPLDDREPCSKFGFSHLTLAERRPLVPVTSIDYHYSNLATKSVTSEEDKANTDAAIRALQNLNDTVDGNNICDNLNEYENRILNHIDMIEAAMYRTYKLNIIDKRFFKYEVTLAISGERIEIDQQKNPKFWSNKKTVTTPIDLVACCEITEQRQLKTTLRIWLKSNSSSSGTTSCTSAPITNSPILTSRLAAGGGYSPSSPSHYPQYALSFGLTHNGPQMRFKHYDFETDIHTAEKILNKLNCILDVRSSEVRREFLYQREKKQDKHVKKQMKS